MGYNLSILFFFSVGSWKVFLKTEGKRRFPCAEANNLIVFWLFKPYIQLMLLSKTPDINLYQYFIAYTIYKVIHAHFTIYI